MGDVGLRRVRPAELSEDSAFPLDSSLNGGPSAQPDALGSNCLPHIDIWVPEDQNRPRRVLRGDGFGDSLLLGSRNQVVHEYADAALRIWREFQQSVGEVVDAVEHLDDDALDSQIIAPHALNEFGVVLALDPDTRTAGNACLASGDRNRT
jgi:hypothetical protein